MQLHYTGSRLQVTQCLLDWKTYVLKILGLRHLKAVAFKDISTPNFHIFLTRNLAPKTRFLRAAG